MLKRGLLNAQGKYLLARLGHLDYLAITDAGFNIPEGVEVVDLAVKPNLPDLMTVLDLVMKEIEIEKIYLCEPIKQYAPEFLKEYEKRFPPEKIVFIPDVDGIAFRAKVKECKGAIRTGQYWLHCPNVVIQAGCTYEEKSYEE